MNLSTAMREAERQLGIKPDAIEKKYGPFPNPISNEALRVLYEAVKRKAQGKE